MVSVGIYFEVEDRNVIVMSNKQIFLYTHLVSGKMSDTGSHTGKVDMTWDLPQSVKLLESLNPSPLWSVGHFEEVQSYTQAQYIQQTWK